MMQLSSKLSLNLSNKDVILLSNTEPAAEMILADKEAFEIEVLSAYLPKQMSDEEIAAVVDEVLKENGLSGMAAMGKAIGLIKPKVAGKADMGKVSAFSQSEISSVVSFLHLYKPRWVKAFEAFSFRKDAPCSFAQSFIKDLLERVDIFDTINRRITLKVKGENGWACCPFHNEKTSSFSVSRQKQFYHCFGCGEHGNAISFLMKYEGLDFTSAVEKLAQENGLQVRYEGNPVKRNPEAPSLSGSHG